MKRILPPLLLLLVVGTIAVSLRVRTTQRDHSGTGVRPKIEPGKVHVQPPELPAPRGLAVTLETYPRTSGSTSAEPLGVWAACRLLGRECGWWESIQVERRLLPLKVDADPSLPVIRRRDLELYSKVQHSGTHGSYKRLFNRDADLIYECRRPSEDEQKLMVSSKVPLDIRPIALDAFVFLRHKDNPVTGLSLAQVRDIYTPGTDGKGRISSWSQVGGPDTEIRPYVRNRNSGSQETMADLVMKERPILRGRSMMGATMSGPYNMLGKDKSGIGFTFFYYQRHMAPLPRKRIIKRKSRGSDVEAPTQTIEMFAIDGVMPSRATITDRTYPLVTEVYVVTRRDLKKDHPAVQLRRWLLTPEGQGVVGETGYVPISTSKGQLGSEKADAGDGR